MRELAKKMLQENHYASKDIKSQKEFLDRGCRSFAMRMNRRRDVILTSLKFHKSAGEVRADFGRTICNTYIFERRGFCSAKEREKQNFKILLVVWGISSTKFSAFVQKKLVELIAQKNLISLRR